MKTTLLVLLAAATGCTGAAHADSSSGKDSWNGTVGSGDTVYVRNINGTVRVVPSKGNAVTVSAVATGGAKLEVVTHTGGVTICGVPKAKSYTCAKDGVLDVKGKTTGRSKIDLEVAVPKAAVLDVSTVNGALTIKGAGKTARASSVNGDLAIETGGPVEGQTVNGSVAVTITKPALAGDVELESVNGSIELEVPKQIDADLDARLVNGKIRSKHKLSRSKHERRTLSGRLGSGGRAIKLRTVNGSIDVK